MQPRSCAASPCLTPSLSLPSISTPIFPFPLRIPQYSFSFTLTSHFRSFCVPLACEYTEPSSPRHSGYARRGAAPRCRAHGAWGAALNAGVRRCRDACPPGTRSRGVRLLLLAEAPSPVRPAPSQLAGAPATPPECAQEGKASAWSPTPSSRPGVRWPGTCCLQKAGGRKPFIYKENLSLAKFSIVFWSQLLSLSVKKVENFALSVGISRSAF